MVEFPQRHIATRVGVDGMPAGTVFATPGDVAPLAATTLVMKGRAVWSTETGAPTTPDSHAAWDSLTWGPPCGC